MKNIFGLLFCVLAACGGKANAPAATNQAAPTTTASVPAKQCEAGHVFVAGSCWKTCTSNADCNFDQAETCQEVTNGDERVTDDGGQIGPVAEPIMICGGD